MKVVLDEDAEEKEAKNDEGLAGPDDRETRLGWSLSVFFAYFLSIRWCRKWEMMREMMRAKAGARKNPPCKIFSAGQGKDYFVQSLPN